MTLLSVCMCSNLFRTQHTFTARSSAKRLSYYKLIISYRQSILVKLKLRYTNETFTMTDDRPDVSSFDFYDFLVYSASEEETESFIQQLSGFTNSWISKDRPGKVQPKDLFLKLQ